MHAVKHAKVILIINQNTKLQDENSKIRGKYEPISKWMPELNRVQGAGSCSQLGNISVHAIIYCIIPYYFFSLNNRNDDMIIYDKHVVFTHRLKGELQRAKLMLR